MTNAEYVGPDVLVVANGGITQPAKLAYQIVGGVPVKVSALANGQGGPPNPGPGPGPGPGDYGGTAGWTLINDVDLTNEPAGTTYTSGVRTTTDQSYNRKSQATWNASGLTINAVRDSSTPNGIASADVIMNGVHIPQTHAIEFDLTLTNTGPGTGHALWMRGLDGNGEVDILEYLGSHAGDGNTGGPGTFETKATLMYTVAGVKPYNQGSKAFGLTNPDGLNAKGTNFDGFYRIRTEMDANAWTYWVNGKKVNSITSAQYTAGTGGPWTNPWNPKGMYPRLTLQMGNGTTSNLWGTVPSSWNGSTIRLSALRIYQKA